jgi:hypothetical protein
MEMVVPLKVLVSGCRHPRWNGHVDLLDDLGFRDDEDVVVALHVSCVGHKNWGQGLSSDSFLDHHGGWSRALLQGQPDIMPDSEHGGPADSEVCGGQ